jgi:monofunctional biosynthetic peptidoglycan transglycosylase
MTVFVLICGFGSSGDDVASKKKAWWRRVAQWAGICALLFLGGSVMLVLLMRFVHPPFSALMVQRRIASWFSHAPYTSRHTWVSLDDMSPSLGVAVIAAEDQNFAEHFGFDWKAIEKAYAHNERSKRKRGASTVSQQTAKNQFCWESRSWLRKGAEAYFTMLIELGWSKRRILEVYLNIVEFGDGVYGVEAASTTYFHKPSSKLRPSEAALLAAVLPNPHKYRVDAPSAYVRGRQAWILRQMGQLGGEQVVKDLGN